MFINKLFNKLLINSFDPVKMDLPPLLKLVSYNNKRTYI